jgi:hypothetical protein
MRKAEKPSPKEGLSANIAAARWMSSGMNSHSLPTSMIRKAGSQQKKFKISQVFSQYQAL